MTNKKISYTRAIRELDPTIQQIESGKVLPIEKLAEMFRTNVLEYEALYMRLTADVWTKTIHAVALGLKNLAKTDDSIKQELIEWAATLEDSVQNIRYHNSNIGFQASNGLNKKIAQDFINFFNTLQNKNFDNAGQYAQISKGIRVELYNEINSYPQNPNKDSSNKLSLLSPFFITIEFINALMKPFGKLGKDLQDNSDQYLEKPDAYQAGESPDTDSDI